MYIFASLNHEVKMTHKKGLHHISVLAGDPKANADFYVNKLGMRMVKRSVNQDDPTTYHLFYGNEAAQPGSSLTFFPWPRAHKGSTGSGEAVNVAFQVPLKSAEYWEKYLPTIGVDDFKEVTIFGKDGIRFEDPDGLELDLIFDGDAKAKESTYESSVPHEHAIQGFYSTRLNYTNPDETVGIIRDVLGFKEVQSHNDLTLFETDANIGSQLIIEQSDEAPGRGGRGIVHHVAFRAKDEEELAKMREQVLTAGLQPTEVIDRHWFKSVYFREPNGSLFELATDGPGYAVDEDPEHLGEHLILPPWLEPRRALIENTLPKLDID